MPQRGWRTARDLSTTLAILALVQLAVSLAVVGTLSPGMLAAGVALILLLGCLAFVSHVQYQATESRSYRR